MPPLMNSTTLCFYLITVLILSLNLMVLWMYSAVSRSKEKVSPNPEDAKIAKDTQLSETTPPETARILRAHANAQASIYPFLFLGLAYTLSGGGPYFAVIVFGIFCAARLSHSYCYLSAKQPLRTITFLTGTAAMAALMIGIVVSMAQH